MRITDPRLLSFKTVFTRVQTESKPSGGEIRLKAFEQPIIQTEDRALITASLKSCGATPGVRALVDL